MTPTLRLSFPHALKRTLLAATLLSTAGAALAQNPGAHVHGQALANVAVQGTKLSVQLELPLDSLLGFEHRPRTDAQRRAAQAALQQLKAPAGWLKPDAAALCTLTGSEINAQALEPAKVGPASPEPAHADVDASYEFNCAAPDKLAALDLGLMGVFQRVQHIEVQVAGAKGQGKQSLRRPASRVLLKR